jgi:nitrate/nitrite-specific signal transduction histidine kinase
VRVRDDGIGLDPQILADGQRSGHWGLPGMRERSQSIGARISVWSERHAGTEIDIRVPGNIAYAQPAISTYGRLRRLFSASSRL